MVAIAATSSLGYSKLARNLVCLISSTSEQFCVEQQLEKLSGTGYRLSQDCVMSISDSKEDIYLCENATVFIRGLVLCLETRVEGMTNTHKQLC